MDVDCPWPSRPILYEINTWPWLKELSRIYKRPITLGNVPPDEWDSLALLHVDAIWLMGIWERSPESIRISSQNQDLKADFLQALPDFTPADNVGSAYCVRRYVVDGRLGGPQGLTEARKMLAKRSLRLILDFVPNHLALDHPWTLEHPEYFIPGTSKDLAQNPEAFIQIGKFAMANGRDPYYPPWQDVVQINAFHPDLRQAMARTVSAIANQCDGMRCDMAMLLLNGVFKNIWGDRAGGVPPREYWAEVIEAVRRDHPNVLFMAEAYWGTEVELQRLGFDYCYDKRFYDKLRLDDAKSILGSLSSDLGYQDKLVRFLENHDEPRAAEAFSPRKERACAVTIMTVPGAKLLYDGQLDGRKVRSPVFLARHRMEPLDVGLRAFYQRLLANVDGSRLQDGEWHMCRSTGWRDNNSHENLGAWCWSHGKERHLVVVNFSDHPSQGFIHISWNDLEGSTWHLKDLFSGSIFERRGDEVQSKGLYVDLQPWQFHFLRFQEMESGVRSTSRPT